MLGINAQSSRFGAISDNIANVRTHGYKAADVQFETLVKGVGQNLGTLPGPQGYSVGGVLPNARQFTLSQGVVTASERATDMAVNGRGFFAVVRREGIDTDTGRRLDGTDIVNTRAGSFDIDKDGYLVNRQGFALLGETLTDTQIIQNNGDLPGLTANRPTQLAPIRFDSSTNLVVPGQATSTVRIEANLPATDAIGASRDIFATVYDSNGLSIDVQLRFTKTALNTWTGGAVGAIPGVTEPPVTVTASSANQVFVFNNDGTLLSPTGAVNMGTFNTSNGGTLTPVFDFGGRARTTTTATTGQSVDPAANSGKLTQIGDTTVVTRVQQDGFASGSRVGVEIDDNGVVREKFSNGQLVTRFRIPLVEFINPPGLDHLSGNIWRESETSGEAVLFGAKTGPVGPIIAGALEESTVDLANEFADMIVTQQAYNANTKSLSTADEMYKTLVQTANN
jgi:flagellar hook protein FlgE